MRSTVIPAQMTTVEDKIASNLSFTQILLLMAPVFWGTLVYAFFFPAMRLALYKLPVILLVTIFCLILAIRIKGKLVLDWLIMILRFRTRPAYYLFNKNEVYLRNLDLPVIKAKKVFVLRIAKAEKKIIADTPTFSIKELLQFDTLLNTQRFTFKTRQTGGLHVAIE